MTYEVSFDFAEFQFDRVHRWLASSYWSPNVRRDVFENAVRSSLCVGTFIRDVSEVVQVGFARAVTDRATFAWLADVYVDEPHRGQGLARRMANALVDHPDMRTIRRWLLATRDAHGVYSALGFTPLADPARWMEFLPPQRNWQQDRGGEPGGD